MNAQGPNLTAPILIVTYSVIALFSPWWVSVPVFAFSVGVLIMRASYHLARARATQEAIEEYDKARLEKMFR